MSSYQQGYSRGYKRKRPRVVNRPRPFKRRRTTVPNRLSYASAPLATRGYTFPFPATELKFLDVASTGAVPFGNDNTGATGTVNITLLNGSVPGTGATTRIGRKITMRSLLMRAYWDSGVTTVSGLTRTMIIYDMQSNGTAPTAADIFLNGGTPFITMPMNLDNRDRFRVLHDKSRFLSSGTAPTDTNNFLYKKYLKLGNLNTQYNAGTAGTVADIQTGALYLVVMTCCGTANVNARIETRIRFADN